MCKIYWVLVFLLSVYEFNSATDNDYYQYVINDKRLPCLSNTDCYKEENNQMSLDYNEDEDESESAEEDYEEGILHDEDIDFVLYDAINDAVQEVNAQKNIFKTMNKRNTRNIANRDSEHIYNDIEELHRKHLYDKTPHKSIARNGECTESDQYCKSILNDPNNADHLYANNGKDSEFYQDGMTKNNLLERKKLELIRHTFTEEKSKLLETDQFIHQIISHLGDLENYEFDAGKSEEVPDYHESIPDIDDAIYQLDDLRSRHRDESLGSPESCSPNTRINENQSEENNNDNNFNVEDEEAPKLRSTNRQEGEEDAADFEDFGPDELTHIGSETDADVSEENEEEEEEEEQEDDSDEEGGYSPPMARAHLEDIIKDANIDEHDNNRDKFVLTKKQYAKYLRHKQPDCQPEQDGLNSDEYDVYKIETEKSEHKRNVNNGLHPFEVPKFEDAPKIHELSDHLVEKLWKEYKTIFQKSYKGATDLKKKHHWKSNQKRIHEHNEEAQKGLHSYTLKENHLTDLHPRHYLRQMTKLTHSRIRRNMLNMAETNDSVFIPDHLDWREKGFITPNWNQEDCGACYAFSVATAIQGQLFKMTLDNEDLSIQQVVDCSIISGNLGCAGGSLRNTLNYVQFAGGLMKDEDYPYKGKQSICKFKKPETVIDISSWSVLPPQDEHALKVALATVGPLAVSINASPHTFQLYSSGIYNDEACSSDYVNHAMLLIGYTRNSWILKNWWSEKWGDKGYMYLKRGHNRCGIANYAVYALL